MDVLYMRNFINFLERSNRVLTFYWFRFYQNFVKVKYIYLKPQLVVLLSLSLYFITFLI